MDRGKVYVFATGTNSSLVDRLARLPGWAKGRYELGRYADGEISFRLGQKVEGREVVVVGSSQPPAENLLEIWTIVGTLKQNKPKRVTLVIPYYGYAKSDRTERLEYPVNARLWAGFLRLAGVERMVAVDLHSPYVEGFIRVPLFHLSALPILAGKLEKLGNDWVVATPDLGGKKRAEKLAASWDLPTIVMEKSRPRPDRAKVVKITGEVTGKNIVIVDDMIQTGGTLVAAGEALKKAGANRVAVVATHLIYSAGGFERLAKSGLFEKIVVSDTIPQPKGVKLGRIFEVVPVGAWLAGEVKKII